MKTNKLANFGRSMMWIFATFLSLPAILQAQTDVDLTEVINYLQAECAEDTLTSSESCLLLETALACQTGDSTSCATIWELEWDFASDSSSTDAGDDPTDAGNEDDDDDAYEDYDDDEYDDDVDDEYEGWEDDDEDWTLEGALSWLNEECAEDTTGLDAACGLAVLAESCLGGDSLACASFEADFVAYAGNGNDEYEGGDGEEDDDDDAYDEEEDDDDDEYEGWEDDDDDDEYEGWEDDDDDWTLEGALSWLNEECAEDTTGLDVACGLADLAEACLGGDSLACASFEADFVAYAGNGNDEYEGGDGDDDEDEDEDFEGAGEIDSDDDGLTDDEETLHATSALNPDTDGDGLSDGDEVLKFNLSPLLPDTDGNGILDPVDLVYTLMEQVNPCPSDLNRDGMVTVADMLMFLVDFGIACPVQ